LKEVLAALDSASKGTSPLPGLLADARTTAAMKEVLAAVAEDDKHDDKVHAAREKLRKRFAQALLAATTSDDLAAAFGAVAEAVATAGTDDPEVLLKAKLDRIVS
jgi:hypothetical protein